MGEERRHCGVSRTRPDHPGLVDPADPIAAQEDSEARRMVLVRVREDERVDPVVPGRKALVESDQEATRIGSPVHEHPTAAAAFDEDGVALANVEHDDPGRSVGMVADGEGQCDRRAGEGRQGDAVPAAGRMGRAGVRLPASPIAAATRHRRGSGRRPVGRPCTA